MKSGRVGRFSGFETRDSEVGNLPPRNVVKPAPSNPDSEIPNPELTVAELGEHALLERILARAPALPPWVVVGVGDDAAVAEPARGTLDVITADALVEGVHFDLAFTTPGDLGFKALAISLSDLAAMGATPRMAVLSLALPAAMRAAGVDELLDALFEVAARHKVALVGGNITRSPGPLIVDLTAIGSVKRRRVLSRAGARPGDELHVSGTLGAAAAGLQQLRITTRLGDDRAKVQTAMGGARQRFLRPEPRVRLGALLGRNRAASACIDLSDGLADAVRQLAAASGVGAVIEATAVPIDPEARRWFEQEGVDPVSAALQGGEDYELLFTVPRNLGRRYGAVRRLTGSLRLTRIGVITKERNVLLRGEAGDTPLAEGFDHFTSRR